MESEEQEAVELSPRERELIEEGLKDLREGRIMTADEAREFARRRTEAWMKVESTDKSA